MRAPVALLVPLLLACGGPGGGPPAATCGAEGTNAQYVAGDEPVKTQATATWTTATSLVGSDFVNVAQLDLELLVSEDDCVHKLTLNVRAPREGSIPFGLASKNREPAFSGAYAGDLGSQALVEASTLELTSLSDSAVSGRFSASGARGATFTLGAFTGVQVTGARPP